MTNLLQFKITFTIYLDLRLLPPIHKATTRQAYANSNVQMQVLQSHKNALGFLRTILKVSLIIFIVNFRPRKIISSLGIKERIKFLLLIF